MEYTIKELAELAGISPRTLRYYDEIGLLAPAYRKDDSGYRIYGTKEVDALQQILFFKELGFELSEIKIAMTSPSFNRLTALKSQLEKLTVQKKRLNLLIQNVNHTIKQEEGILIMRDQEKFEGLKNKLIDENEAKYGEEIRKKYGEEAVYNSNAKMMSLTQEQYNEMQSLEEEILNQLEKAVKNNETPGSETGKKIADLHKKWLQFTWPTYSVEAHIGLVEMYLQDDRFLAYYDVKREGCAKFLHDAVKEAVL